MKNIRPLSRLCKCYRCHIGWLSNQDRTLPNHLVHRQVKRELVTAPVILPLCRKDRNLSRKKESVKIRRFPGPHILFWAVSFRRRSRDSFAFVIKRNAAKKCSGAKNRKEIPALKVFAIMPPSNGPVKAPASPIVRRMAWN